MSTVDSIAWTDIARIANLAEAGFLADELSGLGMEARIQQVNDFNAAAGGPIVRDKVHFFGAYEYVDRSLITGGQVMNLYSNITATMW